jgi:hypothetical protein
MRQTRFIVLIALSFLFSMPGMSAQDSVVNLINGYGTFDSWCVREIEESGIIGGRTKYLYEFYGNPTDTLRTGKAPFVSPDD